MVLPERGPKLLAFFSLSTCAGEPDIRLARWRCGEAANMKRCSTELGPTSRRGYIKGWLCYVCYSTDPTARGRVVPTSLEMQAHIHARCKDGNTSEQRPSFEHTATSPHRESGRQLNFCCDFGGFWEIPFDGCPHAGRSCDPTCLLPSSVLNLVASALAPAACHVPPA